MTEMDPAELKARAEANLESPEGEKQFLRDYYAKKLAAVEATNRSADVLEQYRADITNTLDNIEPLYDTIKENIKKMEAKFPGVKIPLPIWTEEIQNGDIASYRELPDGTPIILMPPGILTWDPEFAASFHAHAGGHAVQYQLNAFTAKTTREQAECFAEQAYIFSLSKTAKDVHKALMEGRQEEVSPLDLKFDDACHATPVTPLPTPAPETAPAPKQDEGFTLS